MPEEIAFLNGWIGREELAALGHGLSKNGYGEYLLRLAAEYHPQGPGSEHEAAPRVP